MVRVSVARTARRAPAELGGVVADGHLVRGRGRGRGRQGQGRGWVGVRVGVQGCRRAHACGSQRRIERKR